VHADVMVRKKQLLYRISTWGFEKNVKRAERGAIIDRLDSELQSADASVRLNGRRLDKSKLDRWRREDKREAGGPSNYTWETRESSRGISTRSCSHWRNLLKCV